MISVRDEAYIIREEGFITSMMEDLLDMAEQDPLRLYGYVAQQITGVLVSPSWDIYAAGAPAPEGVHKDQGFHIWLTVAQRVAIFCSETEPHRVGRDQADWLLLRLHSEILNIISERVTFARRRYAPDRVR